MWLWFKTGKDEMYSNLMKKIQFGGCSVLHSVMNFKFKKNNGMHQIMLQNLYFTRLLYFANVNLFYKANGKRKRQKILNYETVSRST